MDVTFEGQIPAVAEPAQFLRSKGKVLFDTQRLAQTGRWSGTLEVGGAEITLEAADCGGNRDRSWGVRPVGEPENDGIRQGELVLAGMWNYFPMQFDDHAILYICHERDDGVRPLVQAERIWADPSRGVDELGRSEHEHRRRARHPGHHQLGAALPRGRASRSSAPRCWPTSSRWAPATGSTPTGATACTTAPTRWCRDWSSSRGDQGTGPVRDHRPPGLVQLRRPPGDGAARAGLLRALPPLRDDRRHHGGAHPLTAARPRVERRSSVPRPGARMGDARPQGPSLRASPGRLRPRRAGRRPGAPHLRAGRLPGQRRAGPGQTAGPQPPRGGRGGGGRRRPRRPVRRGGGQRARLHQPDPLGGLRGRGGPGHGRRPPARGPSTGRARDRGHRLLGPQRGQGDARRSPAQHGHR